jgi:hypothetical protein
MKVRLKADTTYVVFTYVVFTYVVFTNVVFTYVVSGFSRTVTRRPLLLCRESMQERLARGRLADC